MSVTLNQDSEPTVGRVVALDDAGVTLEVDGNRAEHPWSSVGIGRVQVEFNRPGEHGACRRIRELDSEFRDDEHENEED